MRSRTIIVFQTKSVLEKKIASNANNSVSQECCITLTRSAIIKKASQNEKQNQTTIATNINYIQKFMSDF